MLGSSAGGRSPHSGSIHRSSIHWTLSLIKAYNQGHSTPTEHSRAEYLYRCLNHALSPDRDQIVKS
jgi:hypothetical protein